MAVEILVDQDYKSATKITNLPNATSPQEPATLAQLQALITVGTTAPSSPTTGQLWLDTN